MRKTEAHRNDIRRFWAHGWVGAWAGEWGAGFALGFVRCARPKVGNKKAMIVHARFIPSACVDIAVKILHKNCRLSLATANPEFLA